jgi:16S rRNA processing protein RimM
VTRVEPAFLVVGYVSKPHGMRGELFVHVLTDHPDDLFVSGVIMRLGDADGQRPDPHLSAVQVEQARPFQKGWLVSFEGVGSRDAADFLRGRYLMVERERLSALAEGEVFYHQLIGMEVVTARGVRLGEISEVYELLPADLLEVRTEEGTVLVPFLDRFVRKVDVAGRRLVIDPPDGLLDA